MGGLAPRAATLSAYEKSGFQGLSHALPGNRLGQREAPSYRRGSSLCPVPGIFAR